MYQYTPIPRLDSEHFETKMAAHNTKCSIATILRTVNSLAFDKLCGLTHWRSTQYQNVPVCHFHALLNQLCSEKTWFGLRVSHLVSLHGIMNKKGQKSPTNKLMLIMVESYWCNNAIFHTLILLHEKLLQFDWLRAEVFQLNLKYLHVKITTFCR